MYRTKKATTGIDAGRLVYFHNHGNPGPGLYLPERWNHNRAQFSASGRTIDDAFDPSALQPLPREGFYRVTATFHCCAKKCRTFEPDMLVQLGYDGAARPLLFVPELTPQGMRIPDRGSLLDDDVLPNLAALRVAERQGGGGGGDDLSVPRGLIIH